jgi:protocatechuate 3,4-dioxygenase beta subunit
MKKRTFLKSGSLLGLASLIPVGSAWSKNPLKRQTASCTLIPTETAGPFPLDLTENTNFFRQDISEGKEGVPFKVRLKIIGDQNCLPLANVRVNIWHCDKDGVYSGYSVTNNPGQAGLTYLRGYQYTDANGEVSFSTIFPGWYTGRICHIHFQVYVSSAYSAISQFSFDPNLKNQIYADNSALYSNGSDPMTFASDNVFSDGYTLQLADLYENSAIGGFESYIEVTVQGNGTVGIGHLEKETAKQIELGQNFPNPAMLETTIPFVLKFDSDVRLEFWSVDGKKVLSLNLGRLSSGEKNIPINFAELSISPSNYVYQLEVKNTNGVFRTNKMMTIQH